MLELTIHLSEPARRQAELLAQARGESLETTVESLLEQTLAGERREQALALVRAARQRAAAAPSPDRQTWQARFDAVSDRMLQAAIEQGTTFEDEELDGDD